MIAAPLLPDFPTKPACGRQDSVASLGIRTLDLSWLGVLASGDNRLRLTLRNRFVTAFSIVGTIAAEARDGLVSGNLVEQARQYWCNAGGVICYFDGPDFQRGVNSKVTLRHWRR